VLQLVVLLAVPITILVVGTLNLRVNHRAATPAEQRRICWVLAAGLVASILSFVAFGIEIAVQWVGHRLGRIMDGSSAQAIVPAGSAPTTGQTR
jgi:hypothetical protein